MNLREAAQQALEALENPWAAKAEGVALAIIALRAALADTQQDWDELEALRESLREHMAEIHRLRAALAEDAMQRLTDVQQEIEKTHTSVDNEYTPVKPVAWVVGPAINETRHHKANRMLKEAMDSDRENIIRNMPDFDFDFSTESQKRKPLTDEEITRLWVEAEPGPEAFARAIERAHGIGGEE